VEAVLKKIYRFSAIDYRFSFLFNVFASSRCLILFDLQIRVTMSFFGSTRHLQSEIGQNRAFRPQK
jgi:hypothetical protein